MALLTYSHVQIMARQFVPSTRTHSGPYRHALSDNANASDWNGDQEMLQYCTISYRGCNAIGIRVGTLVHNLERI